MAGSKQKRKIPVQSQPAEKRQRSIQQYLATSGKSSAACEAPLPRSDEDSKPLLAEQAAVAFAATCQPSQACSPAVPGGESVLLSSDGQSAVATAHRPTSPQLRASQETQDTALQQHAAQVLPIASATALVGPSPTAAAATPVLDGMAALARDAEEQHIRVFVQRSQSQALGPAMQAADAAPSTVQGPACKVEGLAPEQNSSQPDTGGQAAQRTSPMDAQEGDLYGALEQFEAHRKERVHFRALDVAAKIDPEALVGRRMRVYWPDDDGWFLGTATEYFPDTGKHKIEYIDGDVEVVWVAMEQIRLLMYAGEVLVPPTSAKLHDIARCLLKAAEELEAADAGKRDAMQQRGYDLHEKAGLLQLQEQTAVEAQALLGNQAASDPAGDQPGPTGGCLDSTTAAGEAPLAGAAQQIAAQQQQQAGEGQRKRSRSKGRRDRLQRGLHGAAVLPGEVVWARSPGWPDWPAIVITPEEADASGVKKAGRDSIPVHWFGTMEFGRVKPEHLTLFRDGLDAGMHRVAGNRNRRLRAACYEVRIYFESGELPAKMVPINNDDPDYDDEDEDDVPARSSAKKAKVASSAPGDVKLPVRLSDALSVHSLGRIEYIHPAFHNEKNFWPVGFSAVRMAATPASANKRVAHRCEILEAADGSGPLFRVTPEGLPAVEAATATKAWAALYASEAGDNGSASMRSLGIAGVRIFGLANPRIMRLLQRLEGANKCERYCSWEGEPPELVPLTPAEQRQRAAALAAMQQLPEGIAAVRAHNSAEGFCHVCAREDEIDGNHLLQCDACRAFVHMDCYGVEEQPNGSLWLCDVCKLGIKQAPACCLCPVQGGLLKPTSCGRWCHVACALWMPETHVEEEGSGAVAGIQQISKARFQLKCSICEQQHGACIQCAGSRACFTAFHPLCARNAGLPMVSVERDASSSDEESDDEAGAGATAGGMGSSPAAAAATAAAERAAGDVQGNGQGRSCDATGAGADADARRHDAGGASCSSESGGARENTDANIMLGMQATSPSRDPKAAHASTAEPPAKRQRTRSDQRRRRKGNGRWQSSLLDEGTDIGAGCRLMCFCAKHRSAAAEVSGIPLSPPAKKPPPGSRPFGAAPAECSQPATLQPQALGHAINALTNAQHQPRSAQAAAAGGSHAAVEFAAPAGCVGPAGVVQPSSAARDATLETCSTGPAGATGQAPSELSSGPGTATQAGSVAAAAAAAVLAAQEGCSRTRPFNHLLRRGHREPDAIAAALAKRAFVKAVPYLRTGRCHMQAGALSQDLQAWVPVEEAPPSAAEQLYMANRSAEQPQDLEACDEQLSSLPVAALAAATAGPAAAAASAAAAGSIEALNPQAVQSLGQRFQIMRQTWPLRVTCGKSDIHGWGAFSKRALAKGDMVLEYVGELVRPSIADAREKRLYNSMVGAGTYVFRMSDAECVDATRKGNLAHLLNHSCDPNCYSRTITVQDKRSGRTHDHVVICAKKDIPAMQELTYDYRFCGDEQLPCNCGAATCRGHVNEKARPVQHEELVPRHRLKPYNAKKAAAKLQTAG